MFCSKCGKQISDSTRFCPECGHQLLGNGATPKNINNNPSSIGTRDEEKNSDFVYPKNPPLSPNFAWLGLIQAGLPHIIFGQVAKGILLIAAFWISMPTGFGPLAILVASIFDAYKVGKALKNGKPVKKWEFFPES